MTKQEFGSNPSRLSITHWLIIVIASIGFLFDTYELLMTPIVSGPAISELLDLPLNNRLVTDWVGRLLWISALCGGIFGLMGGWLVDRFGRKRIMALSIFVYSLSPFCAAYSTSLPMFVFFRCTTFVGVCVEFVAAITWLAEVFEDRHQRERWLGITQAFASLGGVLVTLVSMWISGHLGDLPHFGLPHPASADGPSPWRYTLMTGIFPAIPIALMLPFVPESHVWRKKRAEGSLLRPSFSALFAPELRRVTIVSAVLSACAYGIAFGTLQVTVARAAAGLPAVSEQAKALAPLRKEAEGLNAELLSLMEKVSAAKGDAERDSLAAQIANLKKQIGVNYGKQREPSDAVKELSDKVQFRQEMGGLVGRLLLAILIIAGLSRLIILKVFQIPLLICIPLAYFFFYNKEGAGFLWVYALCGLFTVGQFSYFGEYLPKVFPLHLRGTGGSFATNVGGRMIGTSMAVMTTSVVAPWLAGQAPLLPKHIAAAAGYVGIAMAVISLVVGMFLPEPKENAPNPNQSASVN